MNPDEAERKHRSNGTKKSRSSNQSDRKSEERQARNGEPKERHHLTPSSRLCSIFWKKIEAGCGFEVQSTFPRACHVLAGQKRKDKWEAGIGYRNNK